MTDERYIIWALGWAMLTLSLGHALLGNVLEAIYAGILMVGFDIGYIGALVKDVRDELKTTDETN